YKSKLKNSEKDKDDKINYSNRGFVQGVMEGEVIIEYIKPKIGVVGRNVKGDIIIFFYVYVLTYVNFLFYR
ncbi:flagellar assembly protein A, partial [Campylobacter fetus]|uniref:flagellar assembly protein A n=1 Tax=Campylobacter fetus TaxID=196 RepID=UPI0013D0ADBC